MECTKMNCPMQAGTTTDHCGDNCPWRTTAKDGDLISRAYILAEYDRQHIGPPGGARKIMEEAPAVDAIPMWWITEKFLDVLNKDKELSKAVWLVRKAWQKEQEGDR